MKAQWFLTRKYIKSHTKRCVGIILCVSMFLFAFLTVLWYRGSYQYSMKENIRLEKGAFESVSFCANIDMVKEKENTLIEDGHGIMQGLWKVVSDNPSDIWIGTASERLNYLLPLTLISGEMPQNENEIAVEKVTYDMLGLTQQVGDTVSLTIQHEDGTTEKKDFVLSGVLNNYTKKIQSISNVADKYSIPSILTVSSTSRPSYIHIFTGSVNQRVLDIGANDYYWSSALIYEASQKEKVSNMFLLPMAVFFVLTCVLGVFSTASYFFKEQEGYLNLLRCIGFSKRKTKRLLYFQGTLLWLISWAAAGALSALTLFLIKLISSLYSQKLYLCFDLTSLLLTGALGFIVIFPSFAMLIMRLYRRSPLRQNISVPKRNRKSQTTLKRCWHKAYGRKYRFQSVTCIILILFCTAMAVLGSFLPLFNARGTTFNNPDGFPNNIDYSMHMLGGASSMDDFYIYFPVDNGIPRQYVEEFMNDERVEVVDASIEHLCTPHFLSPQNPENRMLYHYIAESKKAGHNFIFKNEKSDEMIKLAKGNPDKDCLVELPFEWKSYDGVLRDYPTINAGKLDEKKFDNGEEILASDKYCKVGDLFTMVVPVPDKEATEDNIQEHISFKVCNMRVAATYPDSEGKEPSMILSLEHLLSINPTVNYENLYLKNLCPNDSEWTEELETKLSSVEAASIGIQYDNYAKMSREFYARVYAETLQVVVCVLIFIVIILIAIVLSTYVQVRSNLQSYMIMRTIGAGRDTIRNLILYEINRNLRIGSIIGSIIGFGVCIFFTLLAGGMKFWDIYLFYVAPVYILTVLLLYIGGRFAVKRAVSPLINQNMMESLNSSE